MGTVENEVASHPRVLAAAVVAERGVTCVAVVLVAGTCLSLQELTRHLAARGLTEESWPQQLLVLDVLPGDDLRGLAEAALSKRQTGQAS